ncbi:ShKT domain-containing protein [Caenorhabditis elegans]|uniref:ShKT domain-containing protein n=1 Tax=Caenorhabditis elegans TaxID=6239 RepID=O45378_CAEEL|nr:ShKT domain-containing protein [Caenorhabditis elegans]CAB07582.1 ShKT domain-containing protein [Caenorhabditis elegans]|eukprot:NP_497036.1 Uncharacterized protein CELE_F19H8.2 [Caenorhabditis elegans]
MVSRLVVLFISLTFVGVLETADICDILDANYCFYFSDSACYINLCQCEACSQPDKVQALLLDDSSNSTHESQGRLCPSWCGHLKSNETIVNILGAVGNSTTDLQDVSFECDDLKKNCLAVKKYNGHCYFFEKNCEYDAAISKRGKSKTSRNPKTAGECLKLQKKCSQKYKKHYACKTFRRHCRKYNLPEIEVNNSTLTSNSTHVQVSPLEQCLNFQKICAAKYKKHFACRQYRKKCLSYNLPEIHMEKSEVTQKPPNQHKKHMKKGHGMRKEHNHNVNETVVLSTDEIQIGNETLVETLLKDN